jgi:glycosyltransferase involved in cell wall biosynthesis
VRLHTVPIPRPGYRNAIGHIRIALSAYNEITRLGRRGVVHAPEYLSTGIIAPLARHLPVVLNVPANIFQKLATRTNHYDPTFTAALCLTALLSARRCARVVATNEEMVRWWARTGVSHDRLVRVPHGVDTGTFRRQPDARHRLGLAESRQIVLGVGRINRENGFQTLIEAFAVAARRVPTAELHMVGEGPDLAALQALAARHGIADRTIWHGWIDRANLPLFYSAADLYTFTARTGSLPRVVLEAMACGAPVLATRVPGVDEHIWEGQTGYLAPSGPSAALGGRIADLLLDPAGRRRVADAAVEHVNTTLSWEVVVRQLIDRVYRPLLDGRTAA